MPFVEEKQLVWHGIDVAQEQIRSNLDLRHVLERELPDLVLTMSYDAPYIVREAKRVGAKTILGTHFWRNICEVPKVFDKMLTRPKDTVRVLNQYHEVFDIADECYVNSKFMQLGVERYVGKKIDRIIHPILDVERITAPKDGQHRYITMINPEYYKGGGMLVEVAKRMPKRNFLCVGRPPENAGEINKKVDEAIAQAHNIKVIEKNDDMSSIYGDTSVLLIPSIVDETFSMVALEAMWNKVPVVASVNGNLPFLVEDASITLDVDDPDLWIKSIESLLDDEEYYKMIQDKCKERAWEFYPDKEFEKFEEMVKACIGEPE